MLETDFERFREVAAEVVTTYWDESLDMARVMWTWLGLILEDRSVLFEPSVHRALEAAALSYFSY